MKRRKRTMGGKSYMSPDAHAAIKAARAGNCKTAYRHLYDAAPHIQGGSRQQRHAADFRTAAIIIEKLCVVNKTKKRGKYRYRTGHAYA